MTYKLSVMPRERGEKVRKFIREGGIPGVIYGPGFKARSLNISAKEFVKVLREAGESQVVSLDMKGETIPVLIHDVQRHPLTQNVIHVDFYHITKGHKVQAMIPLTFAGMSPGVKDKGGTVLTMVREVEVEALPEELPHGLEIDLGSLKEFGDEILVGDIPLPSGVTMITAPDIAIISLAEPAKEEETPKAEEAKEAVPESPADEGAKKEPNV